MTDRLEYRVQWRRVAWKDPTWRQGKLFSTLEAAERFIHRRLYGTTRPDLSPVTDVELTWREVGPWQRADQT